MELSFYEKNVLEVAPALIGCIITRTFSDGTMKSFTITETEAYLGEHDSACYAFNGRSKRSELLYHSGGTIFMHRCYGLHWFLNIVTGPENSPQGVLIRGIDTIHGPGRVTKALCLDNEYNDQNITECPALSIQKGLSLDYVRLPRVGIGYASPEDQLRKLRFLYSAGGADI